RECTEQLPWVPLHHISNTAALLDANDLSLAMVRCGLGTYGYYPSDQVSHDVPLQPVLSLRSRIARVSTLQPGEGVGYGLEWRAERESRIALVLAGYGDGIPRILTNKGIALVRGRRARYAGRVAMDMLMLDVSGIPDVEVDDEVTLLGTQGSESILADEVGALANTISYEILTGLMERVPRLFVREGRIVERQDLTGYRRAVSAL
ncbi:MAG TPA: alanine racemase, partial [Dehalococcoidia bacterium]|nr:alanine racemase [Dehalococcoidia bacterium]